MEVFGHNGKILRVNLTDGVIEEQLLEKKIYRKYLGGGALSLFFLLKELPPGVEPLGADNILVFAASAVTGTPALGFSRFSVAAKSPVTGGFGESEAGGWWGPELKFAGFDAVIIKGKAPHPVYLWIHDGEAELRDGRALWGKPTGDCQEMIRRELEDEKIRVALIGPGGEKLVSYACILNELKHANGRCGMGAVMGSKNLKAIAVRGTKKLPLHDAEKVRDMVRGFGAEWKKNPATIGKLGTARGVMGLQGLGILPTRNFRDGVFENAESISADAMVDSILVGRGTCYGCFIRCKREVKVEEPLPVDPSYGGPEYETLASFGSLCGIDDLKALARANQICQMYGIDTISAGTMLSFAMECFEEGLITEKDTDGLKLTFGNTEAMLSMLEKLCRREGFGDLLSLGPRAAVEKIGGKAEDFAVHVKGLTLPAQEPRGKTAVGLAYAVSASGPDHMEIQHDQVLENESGLSFYEPIGLQETVPALDLGHRKVRNFLYLQQLYSMYNSIGLCMFTAKPVGPIYINDVVDYVGAVTGWKTSLWELMKVGERHTTMARIFNLREGLGAKDDVLPKRLHEGLGNGPLKGQKIDENLLREAVQTYYGMMGWDEKGVPRAEKLQELDLAWLTETIK
jgi:aldehyde:ferredoxin oxidoreductase